MENLYVIDKINNNNFVCVNDYNEDIVIIDNNSIINLKVDLLTEGDVLTIKFDENNRAVEIYREIEITEERRNRLTKKFKSLFNREQ